MTDREVQTLLKSFLLFTLTFSGYNVHVQRGFNATTQGADSLPTIAFTKITSRRYGFQGRKYDYDSINDVFTLTESWFLETRYQLNILLNQDVGDPTSLSAFDVLDLAAGLLQTESARVFFWASEVGIERVTDIRTPSSKDDNDLFVADASFDIVLTYQNSITSTVNAAQATGTSEPI